ncbi:hypothetical protein EG329_012164 [Mollisiaceae sp. DMI_Dod_QoI]|nr:hypothetical protein EG329_012164 [Helotiales sp. DMI_Dod_QoI]
MKLTNILLFVILFWSTNITGYTRWFSDFDTEVAQFDHEQCGSTEAYGPMPWEQLKDMDDHKLVDLPSFRQCITFDDRTISFYWRMGWFRSQTWAYSEPGCMGEGGGLRIGKGAANNFLASCNLNFYCWNANITNITAGTDRENFTEVRSIMID